MRRIADLVEVADIHSSYLRGGQAAAKLGETVEM
jgi:hypothetical protein